MNLKEIFLPLLSLLLASCVGGGSHTGPGDFPPAPMEHARLLTLDTSPAGYTVATVTNPWDTASVMGRYVLVPDTVPDSIPLPGGTVVRTPLQRAIVYSTVHTSLIDELGEAARIAGVCDTAYITQPQLRERLASGTLTDCGYHSAPDIERIIATRADAILLSPYENATGAGALEALGIPVIECADYMEPTPLGRAEWMKFIGLLFGCSHRADSLWNATLPPYNRLCSIAAGASVHPRVIVDKLYGDLWYVPNARSTMGILLANAGAANPFAGAAGTVPALSGEQVLARAHDADLWLVRYNSGSDLTLAALGGEVPLYRQFAPYRDRRVYGCNTRHMPYYEQSPFHPQYILGDLIRIVHPGLADSVPAHYPRYFTPLE